MALNGSTGNGATLTFSGFTASYVTIGSVDVEVDDIETTALDTTNFKTYIPAKLKDTGELECDLLYQDSLPTVGDVQSLTVTYPATTDGGSTTTLTGTAYVKSHSTPEVANGELMMGGVTFKFDGDTEPALA